MDIVDTDIAHVHGSEKKPFLLRKIAQAVASAFLAGLAPTALHALPEGGQVSVGKASIQRSGANLTITQGTDRAAINWQSFGIAPNEAVRFNQPSASSIVLNRVLGQNPSQIFGSLSANGQVFLLNPNGVLFAPGSQVNVGGIVASTLNLSDSDFLAGRHSFTKGALAGSVVNQGVITASNGGYVALLGPRVSNEGIITARLGTVALAAGNQVTLNVNGTSLVSLAVDQGTLDALAENRQLIKADGGQVILSAKAADTLTRGVVNNSGIIEANTLSNINGVIRLEGGTVTNSGSIRTDGNAIEAATGGRIVLRAAHDVTLEATSSISANGAGGGDISIQAEQGTLLVDGRIEAIGAEYLGGAVRLLGERVGLINAANVDASGRTGGGQVLVGGDYQGKNPDIQNATRTYVGPEATIKADATDAGNGGKVIVWAEGDTRFYGDISARGGANGGDGGFVETSGKEFLQALGTVDASAPKGSGGQWLLDPNNITIQLAGVDTNVTGGPNFTTTDNNAIVTTGSILASLNTGTSVTVSTGSAGTNSQAGDITLAAASPILKVAGGAATLALNALGSIILNSGISSALGALGVTMTTGGTGGIAMNGQAIASLGGNIALNAGTGGITNIGTITAGVGSVTVNTAGDATQNAASTVASAGSLVKQGAGTLTLSKANTYTGATTVSAGTLAVTVNNALGTNAAGTTVASGATLDLQNVTYSTTEAVTLNGGTLAASTGTSSLAGTVPLAGNSIVNVGGTQLTLSGVISGAGFGIDKQSAGTLVLSGNNTYTGITTVSAGTLVLGANNRLANTSSMVVNGGTFDINTRTDTVAGVQLLSGSITGTTGVLTSTTAYGMQSGTASAILGGAVGLNKTTGGSVTLSGANTYTGLTTINAGTLQYGVANAIASGAVTVNDGGIYDLNGFSDTIGALTVNSGVTGGTVTTGAGTLTLGGNVSSTGGAANASISGNLALGANRTFTTTNAADGLTVSAIVSGGFNLTKAGAGTLTLSGANTYTGTTTMSAGIVDVKSNTALGTVAGGTTVASGATLQVDGSGLVIAEPITSLIGTGISGSGALRNLANDNTWSGAITLGAGGARINSDSGTLTVSGAIGGNTRPLTVGGAGNTTISNVIGTTTGTLTKDGAGILTLSAANTYTGLTTINAGTLRYGANNALASGAVTVNDGGTYDLAGFSDTIGALTVNSGATGGSVTTGAGTLTLGGNVTSTGGATNASIDGNLALGAAARTFTITNATDGLTVSALVSGAVGLTKAGAGTLTLSGNNTYTGTTTINAGTLRLAGGSAIVDTGAVTLANVASAILDLNGTDETIGSLAGGGGTGGNVSLGSATLSTGGNNTTTTYSGAVSGTGGLSKLGTGTLTLSGNNSYAGATTVSAGTLRLGAANRIADASAVTVASGATFNLAGFAETVGSIAGAGSIALAAGTLSAGGNNGSTTFSGVISGTGGLTKQGAGTLTLSSNNSYAGATTVSAGTLVASNAAALGTTAGGTTVASGATLEIADGIAIGVEALNVSGTGVGANGALVVTSGSGSIAGAITLGADASIGGNGSLTLSGTLNDVAPGTSTLTQLGAGTLTFSNTVGATNALSTVTTSTGQITAINGGSVRTTGSQTYGGSVTSSGATTLTSTGGGNITANNTGNNFNGNLILSTSGSASIVDSDALAFGASSVGTLTAQTLAGNLTLSGAITASGSGDSIVLASAVNFINTAGATPIDPGAGRYLIYSTDPAANSFGGFASPGNLFGRTYAANPPATISAGFSNRFVYSITSTLNVTADAGQNKVYGNTDPGTYTFGVTGLVAGDTTGSALTGALTRVAGENVGNYTIQQGTLADQLGYTVNYSSNNFAITQRPVNLAGTRAYDGTTNFTGGGFTPTITGTVGAETLAIGVGGVGTVPLNGVVAGTQILTTGSLALANGTGLASNYTLTGGAHTGTITQAALALTANNAAKTYGQTTSFAGTEFSTSGLQNSDTLGTVTLTSAGAAPTAGVAGSPYPIVPSAATGGSFTAGNYTITYNNGTLTVSPAALALTADDKSRPVSTPNPPFTATYSGFAAGEGAADLAGALVFNTPATVTSPPGAYAIVPSGQSATNYTIIYVNGALTITAGAVTPPGSGGGAAGTAGAASAGESGYQAALASNQQQAGLAAERRLPPGADLGGGPTAPAFRQRVYEVESTGILLPAGLAR